MSGKLSPFPVLLESEPKSAPHHIESIASGFLTESLDYPSLNRLPEVSCSVLYCDAISFVSIVPLEVLLASFANKVPRSLGT